MSLVAESLADFLNTLEAASLPVVNDPRNVRPPAVFVDSPSIRSLSAGTVQLEIPCVAVAPPPGNLDALTVLIDLVDQILDAVPNASTITGEPGLYSVGSQDLPAYNLRVTVSYRKDS